MSLLKLREAIVDDIKVNAFVSVAGITVQSHAGRFDATELQRIAAQTPAVHLACLNLTDLDTGTDGISATITWGAFITVKDKPGTPRDVGALAIVNTLAIYVSGQRWNLDQSEGIPQRITANNLYAAHIDKMGIAMWAVTWQQQMCLGGGEEINELAPFITYNATHQLADGQEPSARDTVTLEQ